MNVAWAVFCKKRACRCTHKRAELSGNNLPLSWPLLATRLPLSTPDGHLGTAGTSLA